MRPTLTLDDILAAVRRLPREAQVTLVQTLWGDEPSDGGDAPLELLSGMSEGDLRVLASSVVAPGQQRRMNALLRRNARGPLREEERRELDRMLEEADRIALLKARASYTLSKLIRRDPAAA